MNEHPADKLWKDLPPDQVAHFFKLLAHRADSQDELAYGTMLALAKYLFTANTGAAAGLLFLLNSSPGQYWYLISFFSFCTGTFFVGVCHLTLADWSRKLADGSVQDLNAWGRNEISVVAADANNRTRYASQKRMWVLRGLTISFVLLFVGGLMAGFAIWEASP